MPRIRRKLARILAPLLVALFISSPQAPYARASQALSPGSSAQKSWVDAPARELARRIAASLPGGTRVEIEVRNQSSLSENDASALRVSLADELTARGLRTSGEGPAAASVTITLSENVQGYVWVAQIQHGDDSSVLLQSVPRGTRAVTAPESEKIVLHKELLWSGPAHILDAAVGPAPFNGPPRLLLLEQDVRTAIVTDALGTFRTELPIGISNPRDPDVSISQLAESIEVDFLQPAEEMEHCVLSLGGQLTGNCEIDRLPVIHFRDNPDNTAPSQFGDQVSVRLAGCGDQRVFLAAGKTDDAQSDALLAYPGIIGAGAEVPVSDPLALSGPVTRLDRDSGSTLLAVVRNLQSRDYEVYSISIACGR